MANAHQLGILMFKVALSLFSERYWEFPIHKKIIPMLTLTEYMLYTMPLDLRWRRAEGSCRITSSANNVILFYNVTNENLCAQVRLLSVQAQIGRAHV